MTRTHTETPELLKALDLLEASLVKGGDALQNQAHDGGLATEGTNIQSKAEAKKAIRDLLVKSGHKDPDALLRMLSASDMGSDDDDDEGEGEGGDDDDSGAGPPEVMGKGGVKKSDTGAGALGAAAGVTQTRLEKSLLSEGAGELVDVEPFLRQLVKSLGEGDDLLAKGLTRMVKSLTVAEAQHAEFRKSVANGFVMVAQQLQGMQELVQRIANTPVSGGRAPTVRKSDVQHPDFGDGGTHLLPGQHSQERSPLEDLPLMQIQEGLYELAIKSMVDVTDVTKFENSKGDLRVLPPKVIKALESRLCPAA